MNFDFLGRVPSSKSLYNRALIVQSYFGALKVNGFSDCDDVSFMKAGLEDMAKGQLIQCGAAGTVFRFLSLRASRIEGEHKITGSERLMSRPIDELLVVLRQLGCEAEVKDRVLSIKSRGWKSYGDSLHINSKRSSQFASGVLLNSWCLEKEFFFSPGQKIGSPKYFEMTLKLMKQLGLKVEKSGADYIVLPTQKIKEEVVNIEPDMSCAFAVGAIAALFGSAKILDISSKSLQPDFCFLEVLRKMGAFVKQQEKHAEIKKAEMLKPIGFDLNQAPDLFPILAVLCSLAKGKSYLLGAEQLKYKESDRIAKVSELLGHIKVKHEVKDDGLIIEGLGALPNEKFSYDCDEDHRLAMAAGLLMKAGCEVELTDSETVNKSFPDYWSILGVEL